ncbi:DUF1851 domain-containing protein [Nocardioides sp. ChNu-153]|uniref:T6SS immunity protein Tdi1 domain-containing protein n=1 Tax=unclassified Nocardioides TaxID=2615069 RepID=UPI002406BB28|nr:MULTISPECIES: T6SS immunity protein Tdi1 domain-containing protein [unclassified Nocardioides]MDF9716182.1 DUF1851 domain-containing protein [Nocardioides sp. ChNu-99]MDN7121572.1 DUF1851 domain-containing protein [Nocardioides sp. ChNu-153]
MPVELLRPATSDDVRGLADWTWLPGLVDQRPLLVTAFADVVLAGDDGLWFLSTVEGSLERCWADLDDLRAALDDVEAQDRFLHAWLVEGAARRGLEPGPGQSYAFTVAPVLGGAFTAANVQVLDSVVALSLNGQLHRQVGTGNPPAW